MPSLSAGRIGLALCILVAIVAGLVLKALAETASGPVPSHTQEIVGALEAAEWQPVEPGFDLIRASTASGVVFTGYRFSPDRFVFDVEPQQQQSGELVADVAERVGAVLGINAGFFFDGDDGRLFPAGYLRLGGRVLAKGWREAGGYIAFADPAPVLSPSTSGVPNGAVNVLQSKPMLIEPGAQWAMGTNLGNVKRRSLVCRLSDGNMLVAAITRSGASLFEAGWVLRSPEVGGFFGCDAAIALDGGSSTQVWVRDMPQYSFAASSPVHNFLVVKRRLAQ